MLWIHEGRGGPPGEYHTTTHYFSRFLPVFLHGRVQGEHKSDFSPT